MLRTLLIGIFLCGSLGFLGSRVFAEDFTITAKVPAPLSPYPAIITQPTNGANVSSQVTEVRGTCPVVSPGLIVILWRGDTMVGSTSCQNSGVFSLLVTLVPGPNNLTPKLINILGEPGVDGPISVITYQSNASNEQQESNTQPGESIEQISKDAQQQPLLITTDKDFISFIPGENTSLTINLADGEPPYILTIDWGDGTTKTYRFETGGQKTLTHIYKKSVNRKLVLTVRDKNGRTVTMVLGVVTSAGPLSKSQESSISNISNNIRPIALIASATLLAFAAILFVHQTAIIAAHAAGSLHAHPKSKNKLQRSIRLRYLLIGGAILVLVWLFIYVVKWANKPSSSNGSFAEVQGVSINQKDQQIDSPYFSVLLPDSFQVKSRSSPTNSPILEQLLFGGKQGTDNVSQLAITIGDLTQEGLYGLSDVQLRLRHPQMYQQIQLMGMPSGSIVFEGKSVENELSVFLQNGSRYAVVVLTDVHSMEKLKANLTTIIDSWQWR